MMTAEAAIGIDYKNLRNREHPHSFSVLRARFDAWFADGLVMYRHALLLTGGIAASRLQCESALGTALDACERYFQAFQFVVWAGKSSTEALDAILFETSGEA